jgi:hypothetical protein
MRPVSGTLGIALAATLALSACAPKDKQPELLHLRNTASGPDEFGILPTKPLVLPENLTELPQPTPGGANLTDPTPEADAVAALGGRPERLAAKGVPAADGALVARADRFGASGDIRTQLAAEDLQYRRKHDGRLVERMFNVNVYFKAYRPMALDQTAELERWRKVGVRTPAAPPSGTAQEVLP